MSISPTIKPRITRPPEEDVAPSIYANDPPDERPVTEPPDEHFTVTEAGPSVTDSYAPDARDPDAPRGAMPTIKPRQAEEDPIELAGDSPQSSTVDAEANDSSAAVSQTVQMLPSAEELRDRKRLEYNRLKDEPIKKSSRLKSALLSGLMGLNSFNERPINNWNDFAGAGARAATMAVGGAIDKKSGNRFKHNLELQRAGGEYQDAQTQYEQDIKDRTAEVNIDNAKLKPEFEQQKIDIQKSRLQAKATQDQLNYEHKITLLEKGAQIKGERWTKFVDEKTGKVYKSFPNDPRRQLEPLIDPDTNAQMVAPSSQVYEYKSPSGQTVQVKGRDILQTDVGLAQANAGIANTAGRYNTEEYNDYQGKLQKYNDDYNEFNEKGRAANNLAASGQSDLDALTQKIQGQGYPATPGQQGEMSRIREEIRKNSAESTSYLERARTLTKPNEPRQYTPQTITPGRMVPPSKDPLGLFQQ